jgi:DNA polymerase-3 subunit gamma/tau
MGQALYRKYRSKNLSEIIGQEHITTTLQNALKNGRISHAYLFTGPKGVGKTSVARILAHEINKLPYTDESMHLDIIEIDAASNRRIDEIRDLRDKVHISPTSAKYKVYIIDEVHMLTKEAFNALLKTLEEPPAHVVFILATTEIQKVPETIVSRTQRFTFKAIDEASTIKHLAEIAKAEHIEVDEGALSLLAQQGDGSFRDSISLLDQASASGEALTSASVQQLLGIVPHTQLETILQSIASKDTLALLNTLQELRAWGYKPAAISKQLGVSLRKQLMQRPTQTSEVSANLRLLERLLSVATSPQPEIQLEIVLVEASLSKELTAMPPIPSGITAPVQAKMTIREKIVTEKVTPLPKKVEPEKETTVEIEKAEKVASVSSGSVSENWELVLKELKKTHNTLYGIVRMARPDFGSEMLTLHFQFPFHQKRLEEPKNKQVLTDTILAVTGETVLLKSIVNKDVVPVADTASSIRPENEDAADDENPFSSIVNVFGGGEVLES